MVTDLQARQEFSRRLNAALDDAGIPGKNSGRQLRVAKMFGVSQKGARKWLEGEGFPRTVTARQIADRLKINFDWLMTGDGKMRRRRFEPNARIADNPIIPWSDKEELDPEIFVFLPIYNAHAAAGNGRANEDDTDVAKEIAFRRDFLKSLGLPPKQALCIYVSGDSMSPMLEDGDLIALDTLVEKIIDNKVYAIQSGDEMRVKMIERRMGGGLLLKSLNKPKWQDQEVEASDLESGVVRIIGRLVYQSGRR